MKKISTSILGLSLCFAANAQSETKRPNIILFMVDDMGWQDTSVPFYIEKTHYNETFETPNMERLAARGMMFTQAYASSISSPTRCSLLTGANAARHCVTNWTLEKDKTTDSYSDVLDFPSWNVNGICQTPSIPKTFCAKSFVQILKDNGYHTIHCGKAHFGAIDTPGENPIHFGFEVNIAGHAAGGPASYLGTDNFGNRIDGKKSSLFAIPGLEKYYGKDIFLTEALTIEAIAALDKAKKYDEPFFLYMAHYAIHVPINKDNRFYQKYIDKGLSPKEAAYAALIEGMDKSLGDIMSWLEDNDELDNTVIIFMSDNGGLSCEPSCRDGELHTQNAPLNSGKGSAYEGGIRVPMIVSWQNHVTPQSKCDDYVVIEDFYPTILEIAGIEKYDVPQEIDGISFMPLLNGRETMNYPERQLVWNCPNLWGGRGPGIGPSCTIRRGDWKLVYYYESGRKELFNISEDIGETMDMSEDNPSTVKKMSKRLGTYLRKVGAQRPVFKENHKPRPWPDEL
ncbi:MAG: sulfatase [Bacteroidales bacterium]|nr:sulfatase [Bacteroidales bacterium]